MKQIHFLVLIPLFLGLFSCTEKNAVTAASVSFNLEISKDATPAVLSRIKSAGEKPISEIKFEKGTYHFYPDKAFE